MQIQKVKHLHLEEVKKKPNIQHEYMMSEKLDGWYTYCDFDKFEGWGNVMSSAERVIPSMLFCQEKFFNSLPNPESNCRLIMEAYIPDTEFSILNGVFNRSKGSCDALDVHFAIHDIIYQNNPNQIALNRYKHLLQLEEDFQFSNRLSVLSLIGLTSSKEKWLKAFDTITYNGGEGIILKQANGIYHPGKRNYSLMKIKLEDNFACLCTEVYETFGEKGNRNLNIKVVRKNGTVISVRVGKHSDIASIDENNNSIIGKVVEIKCMKELKKGGQLREPRFINILHSKTKEEID